MAKAVYKELLRAFRTHVSKDGLNVQFREFLAYEFRKNINRTDSSVIKENIALAKDYACLITSIHHHKDLLFSYNIGVDRVAEQQERLKNTAERVGLQMPELYVEDEQSKQIP